MGDWVSDSALPSLILIISQMMYMETLRIQMSWAVEEEVTIAGVLEVTGEVL